MLCCSCAASAKRGEASEISVAEEPRVLEHCRGAEAGCRWWFSPACMARRYSGWVLAIRSPPGNCSVVGEVSTVTPTHIKSAVYGVRKMQSFLVTWQCALPLLAGAGNWTYSAVAQPVFLVFSTSSLQPGDWREKFSVQMQEPFTIFSALHLAATASHRALWWREWFGLRKRRIALKSLLL